MQTKRERERETEYRSEASNTTISTTSITLGISTDRFFYKLNALPILKQQRQALKESNLTRIRSEVYLTVPETSTQSCGNMASLERSSVGGIREMSTQSM